MIQKYYIRATQGDRQAYYGWNGYGDVFITGSLDHPSVREYYCAEDVQKVYDTMTTPVHHYDELPESVKHFAHHDGDPVEIEIVLVEPFKIKGFSLTTESKK